MRKHPPSQKFFPHAFCVLFSISCQENTFQKTPFYTFFQKKSANFCPFYIKKSQPKGKKRRWRKNNVLVLKSHNEHAADHFGTISGVIEGRFGTNSGLFWDRFGIILGTFGPFGDNFGTIWVAFPSSFHPAFDAASTSPRHIFFVFFVRPLFFCPAIQIKIAGVEQKRFAVLKTINNIPVSCLGC